MGPFLPFVETLGFGLVSLSFLVARVGRIALIRASEMGERFGLCSLDFIPTKEFTAVFEDIFSF
jgi:hypothetical protein